MNRGYNLDIAIAITECMNEIGLNYSFNEEDGVFRFNMTLKDRIRNVQQLVIVNTEDVEFYSIANVGGDVDDPAMMANLAEFFCRANYGLKNGNFDMDMNDGEIRYKTFIDCRDGMPGPESIRAALFTPDAMMDRYARGIVAIIFTGATAKDAIAMCE